MDNLNIFLDLLEGSKEYKMEGSLLTIRGWRTSKRITIDLSVLEEYPDVFEEMIYKEEEEDGE